VILVDTDVCIELLKGNKNVLSRRQALDDDIAVSFMTVGELYYGAGKSRNEKANSLVVEKFLLSVVVIESTGSIMRRFGAIKAALNGMGRKKEDADILVAACALEECDTLITGNLRHYRDIEGLVLEDWIHG
jgi:predicted nucleic acid-binding protein